MKFYITIKEQSEAINGKAKYPLYKPSNQKTFDEDHGLETLEQLIQTSSIKIFCDECQKQITFQTIVVAYQGDQKPQPDKQSQDISKPSIIIEEKQENMDKQKQKKKTVQQKLSKVQLNKKTHNQVLRQEIFSQKNSSQQEPNGQAQFHSDQMLFKQSCLQSLLQHPKYYENPSKLDSRDKNTYLEATPTSREVTHLYCVGCFACLQQFPPFYSIRKNLKFSPSNSSWALFDQVNLLNGLKFWGFGNWSQIKQFMDYNSSLFTVQQIQQHYEELYLKGDGPTFPPVEQFDMKKVHKPAKRFLEEIMHQYYFPGESQQNINVEVQTSRKSKKQKGFGETKSEIHRAELQRHSIMGHSSKKLKGNEFLANAIHASNSSLHNSKEAKQKDRKQKDENKKMDGGSDAELYEDSEDQEMNEEGLHEIQLKPKISSQIPESKMSGKGLKQGLSRSVNVFPEQLRSNQSSFLTSHRNQPNSMSISPTKMKGQNVYSYNPKRKEFEIFEYDYYAESMIAQLEFSEEDTEEEINLKLKIIEEYNHRLDERIKRREFVIQHRLLDTDFMVRTLSKYNKPNFQIFQPFRRLIHKNEDYYQVLDSYARMSRATSLTQGILKLNKKLKSKQKHPQLKHFAEYLNQKKEKKQLLGKRARYENQAERKVLLKQGAKPSKKMIISMLQNSHSYVNSGSSFQHQALSPSNQYQTVSRTMMSRSQERQKLKTQSQSLNRQQQLSGNRQIANQNINLSNWGTTNQQTNFINSSHSGLLSILPQEDIDTIERVVKRETLANEKTQDFRPLNLKSYTLKNLTLKQVSHS